MVFSFRLLQLFRRDRSKAVGRMYACIKGSGLGMIGEWVVKDRLLLRFAILNYNYLVCSRLSII